jgi:hypothetical protein
VVGAGDVEEEGHGAVGDVPGGSEKGDYCVMVFCESSKPECEL